MKQRRMIPILAAAFTLSLVALLAFLWPGDTEPQYEGKKLSEWLEVARNLDFGHPERQANAEAAVRSIGTNALPLLLKWVRYAPAQWKLKFSNAAKKLPFANLRDDLGAWPTKTDERHFAIAIKGLEILGPIAGQAVPRLKEIAADRNVRFGREIMRVVIYIETGVQQDEALRKLLPRVLTHMEGQDCEVLLQSMGPDHTIFLTILTDYLQHTNEWVRVAAATLLTRDTNTAPTVRTNAEHVLAEADPALIKRLWPERAAEGRRAGTALAK